MHPLLESLIELFFALGNVLLSLAAVLLPWMPLAAWIVFWTFAVDWTRLREVLLKGAWIPLLLLALAAILVWGTVAPPADGRHELLGLSLSNYVGKTVYVAALVSIMLLCGSLQLTGCCPTLVRLEEQNDQ